MYITSLVSTALLAASAVSASPYSIQKRGGASDKVVAYWGNTGYLPDGNIPISTICANPQVDIVVLSFLTEFPDQTGGVPVLNFGNACGDTYNNGLLKCPGIADGIAQCKAAGKEVLLSLGGAYPHNQAFASATTAKNFAKWLWNTFGSDLTKSDTRPFLTSTIDGIDLDIESDVADSQKQAYFPDFISQLRTSSLNSWKISAAPQCVVPDAHFSDYIQSSWFDYIFVQLYNTDGCSARDLVNTPAASSNTFSQWLSGSLSASTGYKNANTKVFAGLPASTIGSTGTDSGSRFYLTPNEVKKLVKQFISVGSFGGVSLWDATYDYHNQICDQPYSYWVKKALEEVKAGNFADFPSTCPVSSSSSSVVASSTSSAVVSSSSSVVVPTTSSSVVVIPSSSAPASSSSAPVVSSSSAPVVSSSSSSSAGPVIISSSSSSSSPAGPIITSSTSSSSSKFPSVGPYTNSTSSVPITRTGGPRPTSSSGSGSGPNLSSHGGSVPSSSAGGNGGAVPASSSGYGNGGYGGGYVSSSSGAHGGHGGHGKPTATKTSTSTYVDICPTGLTTKTHTWTKTCYEGDDDSATTVPDGWTVTVTVCTACGPKPTTVTLTTPCSTPAWSPAEPTGSSGSGSWPQGSGEKVTSTMVVVVTPVPEAEYWASVESAKSTAAAPVNTAGSGSGSWPAAYSAGSSPAASSAIAKPVAGSPSSAASWALGTGSPAGSYPSQFTGAASKMNVGAGLFAGLAVAALAL